MAFKTLTGIKNPVLEHGVLRETQAFKAGVHNGEDLIGAANYKGGLDYIIAIEKGKVEEVAYSDTRGYYVGIRHANGELSRYLHMEKGSIVVKKGQMVIKGQRIGFMGNSGYVDKAKKKHVGYHVHLAIVNKKGQFVNPIPYLKGQIDLNDNGYTKGDYKVVSPRYVRKGGSTKYEILKVKELTADGQKNCVNKKPNALAQYKAGTIFTALEIGIDTNGSIWARTPSGWICLESSKGVKYCTKK